MGILITAPNRRREPATQRSQLENGFTLIEVTLTVAIVAIVTMIGLLSYNHYPAKVNRTATAQFMMVLAYQQEEYLLAQRSYVAISCATTCTGSLGVRPDTAVATHYTVAAVLTGNDCLGNPVTGPSYVIMATAIGSQVEDGNLCLDSLNNKTPAAKWDS